MAANRHDNRPRPSSVTIPGRPPASMRAEMSELTRPIRRLFGRGRRPPRPTSPIRPSVADDRSDSGGRPADLDRRRHRRVRPAARIPPDGARAGRSRAAGARLAGGPRPPRGRRRAGRPARVAGRADRHAQPRPAPVRAGLLDRRPAPADDPRRPGRAGDPRRAARPRAGARGRRARAARAGDAGRDPHPAAVPAARAAEPAAVADRRVLRPGARGRRRLLRLHRDARRPDRHRRRRRDRQGRPGGAGHGPDALDPACRGQPERFARARSWLARTRCSCRRCRPACS